MFIRAVSKQEKEAIFSGVKPEEFTPHEGHIEWYARRGALRDGNSIFFKQDGTHPEVNAFIDKFALERGQRRAPRSYLYCLPAGREIYEHDDTGHVYFDEKVDRYQIFFDIPEGFKIYHEFQPTPNSIIWFNHKKKHSYKNESHEDVYFMVIDLLRSEHVGVEHPKQA